MACESTFVVLDNGQVHYFETSIYKCYKDHNGCFIIKDYKTQSIVSSFCHNVMVTMKGVVFGFGWNDHHQLGEVDPSALLGDRVLTPTEMCAAITKFKGVATLHDGKELQQPGAHQP